MTSIFRLLFALAVYYKPCGDGLRQIISLSRLCFVTCCLLLLGVTFSNAQPVVPGSDPIVELKAGQLQFLRDVSQSMTLADAKAAFAQGRFTPIPGNLGLGYVPDTVWLHLSISQDQTAARWLVAGWTQPLTVSHFKLLGNQSGIYGQGGSLTT